MKQNIAVLMTVHNRKNTTLRCLRQFYCCNNLYKFDIDFYLMNDGCTDGTTEAVCNEFPMINILKGDGNLYWNRGMYSAWREASKTPHDYYLWLNDDTMLFPNALETLFDDYKMAGDYSIISGCCCDTATQSIVTYGGLINDEMRMPIGTIQVTEKINGNFVLIPKDVYNQIGNLNPYFHHSLGDWEYGIRAKKANVKLYITSKFIGTCDRHDRKMCFEKQIPFFSRLKYLYSPLGPYPWETFTFLRKEKNIFFALKGFIAVNIYCLFPKLKKNK